MAKVVKIAPERRIFYECWTGAVGNPLSVEALPTVIELVLEMHYQAMDSFVS